MLSANSLFKRPTSRSVGMVMQHYASTFNPQRLREDFPVLALVSKPIFIRYLTSYIIQVYFSRMTLTHSLYMGVVEISLYVF